MFGRLFSINVTETKDTYIVSEINGRDIAKFITNVWKTSVLEQHMFKSVTSGRFGKIEFYKFFLIDVIYMLERLASRRNPRVPAKTLNEIINVLKRDTWFKDVNNVEQMTNKLDFNKLKLFNFSPKPYQMEWLNYYNKTPKAYQLNGSLLNAAAGSGKSFTATCTHVLAGCDRIIVVCPKNALDRVWQLDPAKFFKTPPKIWTSSMTTQPTGEEFMFVYHFEALDKVVEHHRNDFDKYRYGLILDECHNLNDVKSQRTQKWLDMVKLSGSKDVIHMSGTPFKAMGAESIPLFRALDPSFTAQVEEKFRKIYGTSAQKGLDILKNRLGLVSFVVKKDQLEELGKPIMNTVGIKIPNGGEYTLNAVRAKMSAFIEERLKYYKSREKQDFEFYKSCLDIHKSKILKDKRAMVEYDKYLDYIRIIQSTTEYGTIPEQISFCKRYEFTTISANLPREYVKEFRSVCSIIKYLALKIQGECLGQVVGKMRVDAHVAMCKYIPFRDICQSTKKKTVVFTSFVEVLEEAMKECQQQELNPILVYGKTNNNLTKLIESFEKDSEVNPLIATYNSLSTAVPLVMADTMIMINAPFRAYIQEQAISRIHRLNQDSQTIIYQLYLDTGNEVNISSRSLDIMKWSQQQVEQITGVSSPYKLEDGEEGSFNVSTEDYFEGEFDDVITVQEVLIPSLESKPLPKTMMVSSPSKRGW